MYISAKSRNELTIGPGDCGDDNPTDRDEDDELTSLLEGLRDKTVTVQMTENNLIFVKGAETFEVCMKNSKISREIIKDLLYLIPNGIKKVSPKCDHHILLTF